MLTSAHSAVDDRIFYREALTLAAAGMKVAVVGRHPRPEVVEGIAIHPMPEVRSRKQRLLLGWHILKLARRLDARLYIFHDPELFGVGFALRLLGKQVVYDSHENLPKQLLQKEWLPWIVRRLLFPFVWTGEYLGSRLLSGVIAAVPALMVRFPRASTILARNFPTRASLQVLGGGPDIRTRPNIAIYAGGLSRIRGIKELVTAFQDLKNAELWLVGTFESAEFQREIMTSLPPNVHWLGWKPYPEMIQLYTQVKLGMVLLHPMPNHRHSLPVKLFEYLGAGLPVVASDFPEFSEYIEGCGRQINPQDPEAIRQAIADLLSHPEELAAMSARARERAVARFSWEPEGERLVGFCRHLMQPSAIGHLSACPWETAPCSVASPADPSILPARRL
jgi:glycosyltransferase involved in cell wall biosynthesis